MDVMAGMAWELKWPKLIGIKLTVLKERLYDEYNIEVPLIQWQDRQFIRISVQGYNTQEDIDTLVNSLKVLLPQVAI